jgi:hypothetical protein
MIIDKMLIHEPFKVMLKSEMKPVFARRENLADIFLNTRKEAKLHNVEEPKCSCQEIQVLLGLDDVTMREHLVNGHLAIKAVDLPKTDTIPNEIRMNLKTIPQPDVGSLRNEVETALEEWILRLEPWIALSKYGKRRQITFSQDGFVSIFINPVDEHPSASIETKRFVRLFKEYENVKLNNKKLFKQCHGSSFVKDIIRMVKAHTKVLDFDHWINHPPIYAAMKNILSSDTEYFSSPLNFNLCHRHYFSEHSVDRLFGSKGNSWKAKWNRSGVANPIYSVKYIRRTLARAQEATCKYNTNYLITIALWDHMGSEY